MTVCEGLIRDYWPAMCQSCAIITTVKVPHRTDPPAVQLLPRFTSSSTVLYYCTVPYNTGTAVTSYTAALAGF